MSFYVTLPSNINSDAFPNNSNSDYTTQLKDHLKLAGDQWEVGLVDIHYPTSWSNVVDGKITFYVTSESSPPSSLSVSTFSMREGRYKSFTELITNLNMLVRSTKIRTKKNETVTFFYDEIKNTTYIINHHNNLSISLSEDLALIMGFTADRQYGVGTHKSERPCDLNKGLTSLFVYCDAILPRLVGESKYPLLRVVPITNNTSTVAYTEFKHVHYMPAHHAESDLITMVIRRDDGTKIPFRYGKVIATLHYRKISHTS